MPGPLEILLIEKLSFRISRHRPDLERITRTPIEKLAGGSDGELPFLEYVHYRRIVGPIRYVPAWADRLLFWARRAPLVAVRSVPSFPAPPPGANSRAASASGRGSHSFCQPL